MIRIGFYGAGLISRMHTAFLKRCGIEHAIVAVHDPDPERAAAFAARIGAVAVGEDELLDLVDAVFVTTWTSEHPRLVEKVAARGLAVFCEKPLGVDAAVVARMVETVADAGVTNQVGLVLRYVPAFLLLKHLVDDERAGRVLAVVFRDDQYLPIHGAYRSTWRADPARAGRGTLLEHSIHDVDIMRWIFGPVRSLSGTTREIHGLDRIDDVAVARLDFESGAVATLTSVWHDILERPSNRHVEVFCERMYAVIDGELHGPVRWQFTGEDEQSVEGDALVEASRAGGGLAVGDASELLSGTAFNTARTFLAAIRDGTAAEPDFREALVAHRLVDAIYASAAAGGEPIHYPER
jgi:predicted dehydrogenase